MAGKKKGKKGKKQEKKVVDEYQLRRDLRELTKMIKTSDATRQPVVTPAQEPRYSEDIRIGGIEGYRVIILTRYKFNSLFLLKTLEKKRKKREAAYISHVNRFVTS